MALVRGTACRAQHISGVILAVLFFFCAGSALAAEKYVLGMSAAFTGPSRGLGIELYRGSMAYFSYLNQNGGINGKPVSIQALDDGYHPEPAIQNTITFMDDPRVQCLFNYVGTPTVTRVLPLLKGYEGTPKLLFFPFTGAEPQRRYPYDKYVFNLRASYQEELAETVDHFVDIGLTRIAVFYQADAYGRSGWDGVRKALARRGLSMVGEATYRRGTPFDVSMAQQVNILRRSSPDVIVSIGSYAACAALIRDARDLGVEVPISNVSFVGSENMVALLEQAGRISGKDYLSNLINTQVVPSYEDLSLPAVVEYRSLMDRFQPAPPKLADAAYTQLRYSFTSFEGFLNAKAMAAILDRLDSSSSYNLASSVESMGHVDIGIDTPMFFGPEHHQGLHRVYFTTVRDGKFVPLPEEQWQQWRR